MWIAVLLGAALPAACGGGPAANKVEPAAPRAAPSGLDLVTLTIAGSGRSHVFTVEVARTPAQQEQGLMNRRALGPDAGMLFPFDPPRPASFWMRNTLIPLDMIFIRPDGTIARIAANTVPLSETQVAVEAPMTAVLELRGGRAAELGIREGDRVSWND
ncbi:MAG: uncharacterized protein QOG13_2640 [Sphingomonadales bacterium]|jgi:uncharacterized membrane protein (UPF0127 family)|nr:uncharacterized protein [Sphingomonadales bacterium]MEA3045125.1 uncharacterized protein [Sphingomonadales bacterium]